MFASGKRLIQYVGSVALTDIKSVAHREAVEAFCKEQEEAVRCMTFRHSPLANTSSRRIQESRKQRSRVLLLIGHTTIRVTFKMSSLFGSKMAMTADWVQDMCTKTGAGRLSGRNENDASKQEIQWG